MTALIKPLQHAIEGSRSTPIPPVVTSYLLINSTDHLLIDGSGDKLIIV